MNLQDQDARSNLTPSLENNVVSPMKHTKTCVILRYDLTSLLNDLLSISTASFSKKLLGLCTVLIV